MTTKNCIKIPLDLLVSLNDYVSAERSNRYKAAAIKKACTEHCSIYTTIAAKHGVKFEWPCALKFTWIISNRRRDPDNIAFAKKFILDGMQASGFLPNDSLKYITGLRDVFVVDRGCDETVIVTMENDGGKNGSI